MAKPKGLVVATRSKTVDELVACFAPFCDEGVMFVSTAIPRPIGSEAPFWITLADKTVALRGWCVVTDAWTTSDNAYARPGMRLGLHRLSEPSQVVFERMLAAKREALSDGKPRMASQQLTQAIAAIDPMTSSLGSSRPTSIGMPALRVPSKPAPRMRAITIPPIPPRERAPSVAPIETKDTKDVKPPAARAKRVSTPNPTTARRMALGTPGPMPALPRPREERRAPGGRQIVPANPFMNMTDALLEGIVECRLFEDYPEEGASTEPRLDAVLPAPAKATSSGR